MVGWEEAPTPSVNGSTVGHLLARATDMVGLTDFGGWEFLSGSGFSEGFVFDGPGELVLAEVLESPWLTSLQDADEHMLVRLRVGEEIVNIAGVSVAHTFNSSHGTMKNESGFGMSGMVRYVWDGEVAFGQIERSGFTPEARL